MRFIFCRRFTSFFSSAGRGRSAPVCGDTTVRAGVVGCKHDALRTGALSNSDATFHHLTNAVGRSMQLGAVHLTNSLSPNLQVRLSKYYSTYTQKDRNKARGRCSVSQSRWCGSYRSARETDPS